MSLELFTPPVRSWFERTFAEPGRWGDELASLVKDGRLRKVDLHRIDGVPVHGFPVADALRTAGFIESYRRLTLRS
jgi:hypothetical protein